MSGSSFPNLLCAYLTPDDKSLILFNGVNHVKLISVSLEGTISSNYSELFQIHDFIQLQLPFEYDQHYGYLTPTPLNTGSGFELKLSFENVDREIIIKSAEKVDLTVAKILSTTTHVYNKSKVNQSQYDLVKKFSFFLSSIVSSIQG